MSKSINQVFVTLNDLRAIIQTIEDPFTLQAIGRVGEPDRSINCSQIVEMKEFAVWFSIDVNGQLNDGHYARNFPRHRIMFSNPEQHPAGLKECNITLLDRDHSGQEFQPKLVNCFLQVRNAVKVLTAPAKVLLSPPDRVLKYRVSKDAVEKFLHGAKPLKWTGPASKTQAVSAKLQVLDHVFEFG